MTEAQFTALVAFVDARIEARMVRDSCGPHVSGIRQASRDAEKQLRGVFVSKRHA